MSCHIVFLSESDKGNPLTGYAPSGSVLANALRQEQGQDEDDQVSHLRFPFENDGAPLTEKPRKGWVEAPRKGNSGISGLFIALRT